MTSKDKYTKLAFDDLFTLVSYWFNVRVIRQLLTVVIYSCASFASFSSQFHCEYTCWADRWSDDNESSSQQRLTLRYSNMLPLKLNKQQWKQAKEIG